MPSETHFHLCPRRLCGNIWSHAGRDIQIGCSEEAHTCPKCGKGIDYWAKMSFREAVCERRAGWLSRKVTALIRGIICVVWP